MTIGLNERERGHIGVITIAFTSAYNIGPPADKLYAVDPLGVENINPSPIL